MGGDRNAHHPVTAGTPLPKNLGEAKGDPQDSAEKGGGQDDEGKSHARQGPEEKVHRDRPGVIDGEHGHDQGEDQDHDETPQADRPPGFDGTFGPSAKKTSGA